MNVIEVPFEEILTISSKTRNLIGIILTIMIFCLILRIIYSLWMQMRATVIKKSFTTKENSQVQVIKHDSQQTLWIIVKSFCFIILIWGISTYFNIPLFFESGITTSQIDVNRMDDDDITMLGFNIM